MKKKLIILTICFTIPFSIIACDTSLPSEKTYSTNYDITDTENFSANNNIKESEPLSDMAPPILEEKEAFYPSTVTGYHNRYITILESYFSDFSLSDISEESYGESIFYSFKLYTGNDFNHPTVTFQNESSSFRVSLPDEIENSTLKEVIRCTVMVLQENIDETTATDITQTIVNGFNGIEDSPITSIDNYKLYISASSGITQRYFKIVNINEINTPVDISEYPEASKEVFNGSLNQGSKTMLKGTISKMGNLGNGIYGLEVNCGSDVYLVYFNFDSFIDCFEIGEKYTFYGTIAAKRDGYAGCLRLDYVV